MHSHKQRMFPYEWWGDVLILVLMEDALARFTRKAKRLGIVSVLILVLMEDALAHYTHSHVTSYHCGLNPCFNGRCTRTLSHKWW